MQESRGNKTIGEIVADDIRTARVFDNHGIDFYCGGKVTLEPTCTEKGLDLVAIISELDTVQSDGCAVGQDRSKVLQQ